MPFAALCAIMWSLRRSILRNYGNFLCSLYMPKAVEELFVSIVVCVQRKAGLIRLSPSFSSLPTD